MAKQKADMANKEKEAAILKLNSLQKEVRLSLSKVVVRCIAIDCVVLTNIHFWSVWTYRYGFGTGFMSRSSPLCTLQFPLDF